MISLEKLKILTPLQKLPKNVGDFGKLIVAKGFEKLPKVTLPLSQKKSSPIFPTPNRLSENMILWESIICKIDSPD